MYCRKVEITGINTNELITLNNEEMLSLFKELKNGNEEAKEKLYMGNLLLVLSILKRFNINENDIDDMFQIGCQGLGKAIDNFDLNFGVRFSTYAVPLIIGEMKRAKRDSTSLRVSRGIKDMAYKILAFKDDYLNKYGEEPKDEIIAKALEINEYSIPYCLNAIKEPKSIYAPIYDDGGEQILVLDQIKKEEPEYDPDMLIALKKALDQLSFRERQIIYSRYYVGKTQTEIAKTQGISQAQVSRIEATALKHIRGRIR